ncbi:hypothetical protein IW261DRAFT_987417 [Armillaria novae-zelandiae]|uniref:Uncharacterized protein n=1 Tax=Armillaria novae-zelandiae TaxID=153914 RepID=A0AA39PGP1_9AGAR|nr:hypothetical protein IW261DRAFT_987417 [Armillaria novae-zelandiae]
MTAYLPKMFVVFVRPSNHLCDLFWFWWNFLFSSFHWEGRQIQLQWSYIHALVKVFRFISNYDFLHFSEADAAILDVLDRFVTSNVKFISILEAGDLYFETLTMYTNVVLTRYHTLLPTSLEVVVNLMFDHYNSTDYVAIYAGRIIASGLRDSNLSIFVHHSNHCIEPLVVQEQIEFLHTPDILFDVCSILAVDNYLYPHE